MRNYFQIRYYFVDMSSATVYNCPVGKGEYRIGGTHMPKRAPRNVVPLKRDLSKHFRADLAKDRNIIGQKIAAARKKAGLSQPELSELLLRNGVHILTPGLSKWEKGETIPNAYQLLALCDALNIETGLQYFMGVPALKREALNNEGLRMLNSYREYLESKPRYTNQHRVEMIRMRVSQLPASAGYGDYLDDESFETMQFPASAVPDGADFAVPVDGDSMEPLFHDGELAWIQLTPEVNVGDIGLFILDGSGYIKLYDEREPEDAEEYIDSNGFLHPQIVLISQNDSYEPMVITPEMDFRVVGKVLK